MHIDFETYSECDLKAAGAAAYACHPSTDILCMGYEGGVWIPGQPLPFIPEILHAWNAQFEYWIWNAVGVKKYGFPPRGLECWVDTMAAGLYHNLPGGLDKAATFLKVGNKLPSGTRLINMYCKPPRKPVVDPEMYLYCAQDVNVERQISKLLPPLPPFEAEIYQVDQIMNARGVAVDTELVNACVVVLEREYQRLASRFTDLTGFNPTQTGALTTWLGGLVDNVQSGTLIHTLDTADLTPVQREAIEIRLTLGLASVKKLYAIQAGTMSDGRLRGMFQYYGASKTGRWAGRRVQLQNLTKPPEDFDIDTEVAKLKRHEGSIHDIKNIMRNLFIGIPQLICSDYSAIEAVVLAQLAGEDWRLDVFRTHGKIYETSAAKITGVTLQEMLAYKAATGKHHPMRSKIGKVAELASGYYGGLGAWKRFGAGEYMSDDEIRDNIRRWRDASPMIKKFWYGVEAAAVNATLSPGVVFSYRDILYCMTDGVLACALPSGRRLFYHGVTARQDATPWGDPCMKLSDGLHGGVLTENIVQAVSRDLLANALVECERQGLNPVIQVHDEIACETCSHTVSQLEQIMNAHPCWAANYPVAARGGWSGYRFRK